MIFLFVNAVFNYQSGQDSVLEVKGEDYANCNTNSPISKFSDGHTVFKFNHSGHHFFISGNKDNCLKNEKLVIIVLANRNNNNQKSNTTQQATTPSPSPSPSISPVSPPSPSPASASPPAPPPSSTASPPSPPPGAATGANPTPAPVTEPPPHKNAASSVLFGFAGSVGALSLVFFSL